MPGKSLFIRSLPVFFLSSLKRLFYLTRCSSEDLVKKDTPVLISALQYLYFQPGHVACKKCFTEVHDRFSSFKNNYKNLKDGQIVELLKKNITTEDFKESLSVMVTEIPGMTIEDAAHFWINKPDALTNAENIARIRSQVETIKLGSTLRETTPILKLLSTGKSPEDIMRTHAKSRRTKGENNKQLQPLAELPNPYFEESLVDDMETFAVVNEEYNEAVAVIGKKLIQRFFPNAEKDVHPFESRVYASFLPKTLGRDAQLAFTLRKHGIFIALWQFFGFMPGRQSQAAPPAQVNTDEPAHHQMQVAPFTQRNFDKEKAFEMWYAFCLFVWDSLIIIYNQTYS